MPVFVFREGGSCRLRKNVGLSLAHGTISSNHSFEVYSVSVPWLGNFCLFLLCLLQRRTVPWACRILSTLPCGGWKSEDSPTHSAVCVRALLFIANDTIVPSDLAAVLMIMITCFALRRRGCIETCPLSRPLCGRCAQPPRRFTYFHACLHTYRMFVPSIPDEKRWLFGSLSLAPSLSGRPSETSLLHPGKQGCNTVETSPSRFVSISVTAVRLVAGCTGVGCKRTQATSLWCELTVVCIPVRRPGAIHPPAPARCVGPQARANGLYARLRMTSCTNSAHTHSHSTACATGLLII